MILHHQNNVAGFAGGHTTFWVGQPITRHRISATSVSVLPDIITTSFGRIASQVFVGSTESTIFVGSTRSTINVGKVLEG